MSKERVRERWGAEKERINEGQIEIERFDRCTEIYEGDRQKYIDISTKRLWMKEEKRVKKEKRKL